MKKEKEVITKSQPEKVANAQEDTVKIPRPKPTLSEDAIRERELLAGMLIHQTEEQTREAVERKKKRDEEEIELRSGEKISVALINNFVTALRQPYDPVFPNSIPFYKEIFRLNGWDHLNPSDFIKPAIVGNWTVEILYSRLGKDVFPAISVLNPALSNGIRIHKCFQFLTEGGRAKFIRFRDEAIELMKKCSGWIEFRRLLFQEHGVPYQANIFDAGEQPS